MCRHPRGAHAYPLPPSVFQDSLERPVRLVGSPDSAPTGQVAGSAPRRLDSPETPLCDRPTVLSRKPAGAPPGAHVGRMFYDPRTSCGDTNGSTLQVAKQVRRIQNPQSCRQAHRISRFPSAPFPILEPANAYVFPEALTGVLGGVLAVFTFFIGPPYGPSSETSNHLITQVATQAPTSVSLRHR